MFSNWPSGAWHAFWYHATNAALMGHATGATTNGVLTLPLPEFSEDLVGRIIREFAVQASFGQSPGVVRVAIVGDPGLDYELEAATNFAVWSRMGAVSNAVGNAVWEPGSDLPLQFFRGRVPP